jgi:Fe-S cluster assembly ATPase SufC
VNGSIVLSGGRELAEELEAKGYDFVKLGIADAADAT